MLTPREKNPSTRNILLRGGSNPRHSIKQDSEPNTLLTIELFRPHMVLILLLLSCAKFVLSSRSKHDQWFSSAVLSSLTTSTSPPSSLSVCVSIFVSVSLTLALSLSPPCPPPPPPPPPAPPSLVLSFLHTCVGVHVCLLSLFVCGFKDCL